MTLRRARQARLHSRGRRTGRVGAAAACSIDVLRPRVFRAKLARVNSRTQGVCHCGLEQGLAATRPTGAWSRLQPPGGTAWRTLHFKEEVPNGLCELRDAVG